MSNARYAMAGLAVLLALLFVLLSPAARAQQDQPPSGQDPSMSSSSSTGSSSQDPGQEPVPDHPETSTLETGQPMGQSNRVVALRWGHLANISVESFYAYDSNYTFSPSNPAPTDEAAARVIADYSLGNERMGLDIQYRPFIVYSKREQTYNFAASFVNFHVTHRLGSRWIFNFHDIFQYEPDVALFINPTITPNLSTGEITQAALLGNGSTLLRNNVSMILSYHLARHDTISFHGQYNYVDLTNNPNEDRASDQPVYRTESTLGGGVGWSHTFGPDHEFGVTYNYDEQVIGNLVNAGQHHSVIANYRQKILPTLLLQVSGGPSWQIRGNGLGDHTTYIASAELLKTFRQSTLALLYSRNYDYTGVITDAYHDRYDALYSRNFDHTWGFALGGSYFQTHSIGSFMVQQQIEGRTLWGRVSYYLNPQWTLFATMLNSAFAGGPTPYASRNFFMAGVRWSYGGDKELRQF
jgi:hypothetical protein